MKRLQRVLIGVLCAAQLCGCAAAPAQPSGSGHTAQTLRFIVGNDLGVDMLAAADAFADRVARVSGGSLTIDVRRTGRAEFGALARGDAELMLLRNTQLVRTDSLFSMFTLPFLYDDNRHMSLALNAQDVRARVNEALAPQGVRVLTAIYTGGLFFVSDESELRTPDDFRDLPVAMRTDSADKLSLLGALGAQVVPYSKDAIPAAFDTQAQYLPPGGQTPRTVTIGTAEVEASQLAQIEADPNTLYLIKSYHACAPVWLAANTAAVDGLGAYEQAVLSEACAGLLAELEAQHVAAEQADIDEAEKEGMLLVEPERAQIAAALYDSSAEEGAIILPAYFDRRLYDLIQSYATLS